MQFSTLAMTTSPLLLLLLLTDTITASPGPPGWTDVGSVALSATTWSSYSSDETPAPLPTPAWPSGSGGNKPPNPPVRGNPPPPPPFIGDTVSPATPTGSPQNFWADEPTLIAATPSAAAETSSFQIYWGDLPSIIVPDVPFPSAAASPSAPTDADADADAAAAAAATTDSPPAPSVTSNLTITLDPRAPVQTLTLTFKANKGARGCGNPNPDHNTTENYTTQYLGTCRNLKDVSNTAPYNTIEFTRVSNELAEQNVEIVLFTGSGCVEGQWSERLGVVQALEGGCKSVSSSRWGSIMIRRRD